MKAIETLSHAGDNILSRFRDFSPARKAAAVAGASALGLAGAYVLDVWTLGTAAAWLHGLGTWLKGQSIFATSAEKAAAAHAFDAVSWYWHHPFSTARAWLTGSELTNPGHRKVWLYLHGFAALGAFSWWLGRRYHGGTGWSGIRMKPGDATHGSARWAETRDLARVLDFGFGPGILLGKHKNKPVRIPQKLKARHNKNVLVIGSPGCGKSYSYVRSNIFTAVRGGESIIVTDPKGELYRDMAAFLKSKGYVVKVLNLVRMWESHVKNFLDEIRTPLDADVFAQVVIATTEGGPKKGGDGFWDRAEQNLLKALALYVCYDENGDRRRGTMGEIYDLIASGDKDAVNRKFEKLPPKHPAYGPYMISKMAGENVWGNIIIGLGTRLQTFQQEEVRRITEASEIDLNLPGKEKCAYFVITPDTHPAFNFLASLFFTFTFIRLIEQADANKNGRLNVPVKMLLDEFANIVSIPDFEKKIATARSRGIECHVIIQSLPQLIRVYGRDSWQEIRACCSTVVVLKVEDDYTADYVSRQLGKTTVETSNRSREIRPLTGPAIFDERENRSVTARPLMTPDEIIRMPASQCIVFLPSPNDRERVPALLSTLGYTEFPEAAELSTCLQEHEPEMPVYPDELATERWIPVQPVTPTPEDVNHKQIEPVEAEPPILPSETPAGTDPENEMQNVNIEKETEPTETGTGRTAVPW
ncbi:MAG TPA: type IV secretory system conjugative DNA transfer family protein [Desulfotomaculum sp.]|nr:type IV secretory system conjugative DNA transfer family protein [Desulfotomaculum sp.]